MQCTCVYIYMCVKDMNASNALKNSSSHLNDKAWPSFGVSCWTTIANTYWGCPSDLDESKRGYLSTIGWYGCINIKCGADRLWHYTSM